MLAALAVCISASFQILLPVVPVMVERSGPQGGAGAATAALFIGAVAGELSTPWLMSRQPSKRVLVAGLLLTAVPSLVYGLPHPWVWAMIAAATTRGVGFGAAIVVSVALLSEMTATQRRGAAIGVYGLALGVPGVFVPSIGVYLLASGHAEMDALIALSSGLVGALVAIAIPNRPVHIAQASTNLLQAIGRPGMFIVVAGFVLISCSFGGVVTYAPLALPLDGIGSAASFFLISGAARALSRWFSGILCDRHPAVVILIGGAASSLGGLIILALHIGGATVLVAAVAYGAGYGAAQTAAYLAMSERGTHSDAGAVSALWNSGIDFGSSIGGTLVGVAAAKFGYDLAVWLLPVVVLVSLPLFVRAQNKNFVPLAPEVRANDR